MKNKKHLAFLGAIILFVVVLASGVYTQEDLRRNGQQVILSTMPVDPRDILRGDYVDLAYEIGRGEKAVEFAKSLPSSQPVYALLTLGEDNRVINYAFSTTEPQDGVYIRGEAVIEEVNVYVGEKENAPMFQKEKQGIINYPQIEQYFVPEGKGWAIDRMGRLGSDKKLEVKIATDGLRAQILELLIDGKPIDFDTIESENPWTDEPVKPEPVVAPIE
ncbi:GDYXXLXY domain-containing protein [Candidatus Peribacteria bacterium]|nr:GDYXXLXY domain-containing protein [Candidatus Peribacteria bacterium]